MIMADVYVPSIGRQYDFSLDEQAVIAQLIPEIAEVSSPLYWDGVRY